MTSPASGWLITELRLIRERENLTQEAFAARIHFSAQHVSGVECGSRPITRDYLAAVDRAFKTNFGSFHRVFMRGEFAPLWLRPWLEYEERATALRIYQPLVIPGLLQTEEYATMILSCAPFHPDEVARRVQARMERQPILDRQPPVRSTVIVDEITLRRGDPTVLLGQLHRLAELAERPAITIRVVPADAPPHLGWGGPITIASLPDGDDVGLLDNWLEGSVVTGAAQVAELHAVWDAVSAVALPARQSLELLRDVIKSWP